MNCGDVKATKSSLHVSHSPCENEDVRTLSSHVRDSNQQTLSHNPLKLQGYKQPMRFNKIERHRAQGYSKVASDFYSNQTHVSLLHTHAASHTMLFYWSSTLLLCSVGRPLSLGGLLCTVYVHSMCFSLLVCVQ